MGGTFLTRRWLSVRSRHKASFMRQTVLLQLMNFSHARANAGFLNLIFVFRVKSKGFFSFLMRWDLKLSLITRCFSAPEMFHHCITSVVPCFLSGRPGVCSVLMNERGELRPGCSVFSGLCACGLCGLSHSEEPSEDISGHRLSWVQAHTELLTDTVKEERGMFSYWEETRLWRPDDEGERETRIWNWLNLCNMR